MLNAALSEGRLEGGFVENNTYTKLYDEYWKRMGVAPNAEEQLDMRKRAKEAGFRATWKNALLINYTNKLAFPNLFRGSFLKGASYNAGRVNNLFSVNYKAAATPGGRGTYELVDYNLKNALKGLTKPKNFGKATVNYFKLNVVEGVQEVLQDVIAKSTEEYYTETFFDKSKENQEYSMATLMSAFGDQFGAQGFETFASGFFMGTLLRPINTLSSRNFLETKYNRYTMSKEDFKEYEDLRRDHGQRVVDAMNRLNDPIEVLNNRAMNFATQAILAKNNNNANINTKDAKDNVTTSLVSDVVTALENNMYGVWLDNFKNYDQMDAKGFEEAFDLQEGQGEIAKQQLQTFLKRAERIKSGYEYGLKNIANKKVNLNQLKKGTPEYDKAAIFNKAIDTGLWNLVFFQESFTDALERVNELHQKINNLGIFSDLPAGQFQNLTDLKKLSVEIEMLNQKIEVMQQSQDANPTVQQGNEIDKAIRLRNALVEFQEAQRGWTVEAKELLVQAFQKYQAEDGTISKEDTEKALDEVVSAYENNFDPNINYRNAFQNLLRTLVDDDVVFQEMMSKLGDEKFNELYQDLLDIHGLEYEKARLIPAINMLLDPNGFDQHVQRNFDWMRNLWLSRSEYYKKAVNDAIEMKEYNDLLWSLSQDNIYIDLEEFAKWIEDKENYVPKEFIDVSEGQERIIPQGSMLFDKYYEQFRMVTDMQKVKAAGEESNLTEQRDKAVADLLDQKEQELEQARKNYEDDIKTETGSTVEEITAAQDVPEADATKIRLQRARIKALEKEKGIIDDLLTNLTASTVLQLNDQLQNVLRQQILGFTYEEFQSLLLPEFVAKAEADPAIMKRGSDLIQKVAPDFSDFDLLRNVVTDALGFIDQIDVEVAEISKFLEEQEASAETPRLKVEDTQSYKDYQSVLEEINSKYEGLIEEVNKNFRERGMTTEDVEVAVKTTDEWNSLPQDLKDELQPLFDKRLNDPTLKEMDVTEYERRRQAWFETQSAAVNAYNDRKNVERLEAEKEAVTIKEPKLKFKAISKVIDKSMGDIQQIIDTYKIYLDSGTKPKGRLKSEKLTKTDIANLQNDINELETLLDKKRRTFESLSEYTEVIRLFKQRILDREAEVVQNTDDQGNVVSRTIDGKPTTRVTSLAEQLDFEINNRKFEFPGINTILPLVDIALDPNIKDNVAQFMTAFRQLKSKYFNNAKYDQLESKLRAEGLSRDTIGNILSDVAFEASRQGGNAVDVTSKDFFTILEEGGFAVPERPANMTKEAFDQLYGKNGIITKFRDRIIDGEFQIIGTSNILFDKQLGIAGETDLIAVSPQGEFMIIDIKSLGRNSWRNFNNAREKVLVKNRLREEGLSDAEIEENEEYKKISDRFSDRDKFRYQQSLYRNLFFRMTGKMPRMAILPIQLEYDKDGNVKSASTPTNVMPADSDVIMLDYADEVEKFVKPEAPTFTEQPDGTETIEEPVPSDEFLLVEEYAESTKLKDNLGKMVIYEGQVGTLVQTPEGSYGVQFSDPRTKQSVILDILDGVKEVTDGDVTLNTVSLGKIQAMENLGQVSTIEGVEIDAFFIDNAQNIAIINGVQYTVNRDKLGKIVSLSYNTNDARISDLENEIYVELDIAIAAAEQWRKFEAKTTAEKNMATNEIAQYRIEKRQLQAEIEQLRKTNSKRTARGGNANAMIFALNRLPSNFSTSNQEISQEEELDNIKRLATISDAMFDAVAAVMINQYPEVLDQLIDKGPSGLKQNDYLKIKLWAEEVVTQLTQLEAQTGNKGELTTYINGVKNQIIELQNHLELIKLTKDGKISKQQPKAREVFGPKAEVPFRFDISNVQGADTGPAEGVPGSKRQPTNKEASEIIEEELNIKTKPEKKSDTQAQDNLIEKIEAATKENFETVETDALILARNNKNIKEADIMKALRKKKIELETTVDNVAVNDYVISKSPIFESENPVTMRVTKVFKNGNVNLEDINDSKNKLKLTMEELQEQFNTVSPESEAFKEEVVDVKEEDQGGQESSKESLDSLSEEDIQSAMEDTTDRKTLRNNLKNRNCKI